jgi:hypothetical protein
MIGFGLCKNNIPSPSLSSVAYADEPTTMKPMTEKPKLIFTNIFYDSGYTVLRAKVIGGWLIESQSRLTTTTADTNHTITFFPDPKHEWDGGSIK